MRPAQRYVTILDLRTIANSNRILPLGRRSILVVETISQPTFPLEVEAWVNGNALTDKELEGKVVLIDFWAVWCGPCIATFPHLREWRDKYSDKGLVIIGRDGKVQMIRVGSGEANAHDLEAKIEELLAASN